MNHAQEHHTNGHNKKATSKVSLPTISELREVDVVGTIKKHPLPAVAIASAIGAVLGLTLGSKAMRVLVGSVGMYTLTEVLQRFAKHVVSEASDQEGQ